ncbi:MAG: hypothetical protein JO246_15310 [Frankiaceae bacterium]|nr:hypothetical protein [Frankiaceae bacterium]
MTKAQVRCGVCGASTGAVSFPEELCPRCRRTYRDELEIAAPEPAPLDAVEKLRLKWLAGEIDQPTIAAHIGVKQPYVSRLLNRSRRPSPMVARAIARLVGEDYEGGKLLGPDDLYRIAQVVRMAESLRTLGRAETALPELSTTIRDLDRAWESGQRDEDFALVYIDALLAYAVTLGDLSPDEESGPLRAAQRAVTISESYANNSGMAYALNTLGNQQRIANQLRTARETILRAASLEAGALAAGASASWLARIVAEQGDEPAFEEMINRARRALDRLPGTDLFVNPLSIAEIEIRGLLKLGKAAQASSRLSTMPEPGRESAPQWQVISAITAAEGLVAAGEIEVAIPAFAAAADAATRQYMPRQLQRIVRALVPIMSPASQELVAEIRRRIESPEAFTG